MSWKLVAIFIAALAALVVLTVTGHEHVAGFVAMLGFIGWLLAGTNDEAPPAPPAPKAPPPPPVRSRAPGKGGAS